MEIRGASGTLTMMRFRGGCFLAAVLAFYFGASSALRASETSAVLARAASAPGSLRLPSVTTLQELEAALSGAKMSVTPELVRDLGLIGVAPETVAALEPERLEALVKGAPGVAHAMIRQRVAGLLARYDAHGEAAAVATRDLLDIGVILSQFQGALGDSERESLARIGAPSRSEMLKRAVEFAGLLKFHLAQADPPPVEVQSEAPELHAPPAARGFRLVAFDALRGLLQRVRRKPNKPKPAVVINGYTVEGNAIEGGMSKIYRVTKDGKTWALKEFTDDLNPEWTKAWEREHSRESFREEYQLLAELSHRHFPQVKELFEENGRLYYVMEFLEGGTLEDRLEAGIPMAESEAVRIASDLLLVLEDLHAKNPPIIHRDIKPGNIMFREDGGLVLIDFGVMRRHKPGKRGDTYVAGTAGYGAPEQFDRGQTDQRSDIYSVGVVLHRMLTGLESKSFLFEAPHELNSAIKQSVSDVAMRALQYRPQNRFPNARSMRVELANANGQSAAGESAPAQAQSSLQSVTSERELREQVVGYLGYLGEVSAGRWLPRDEIKAVEQAFLKYKDFLMSDQNASAEIPGSAFGELLNAFTINPLGRAPHKKRANEIRLWVFDRLIKLAKAIHKTHPSALSLSDLDSLNNKLKAISDDIAPWGNAWGVHDPGLGNFPRE